MFKSLVKSSGRVIANTVALAGTELVSDLVEQKPMNMPKVVIDSSIMGVATMIVDPVNNLISSLIRLPTFIKTFEASYGVDILLLGVYVAVNRLLYMYILPADLEIQSDPLLKVVLEAVGALLISGYIRSPLDNFIQSLN